MKPSQGLPAAPRYALLPQLNSINSHFFCCCGARHAKEVELNGLSWFISLAVRPKTFHQTKLKKFSFIWFHSPFVFSFICLIDWFDLLVFSFAEHYGRGRPITHHKMKANQSKIKQITLLRASCFAHKLFFSFTIHSLCIRLGGRKPATHHNSSARPLGRASWNELLVVLMGRPFAN